MSLQRNKIWAAVFQLLGASLLAPSSPSALFCPASALPAGVFCARGFIVCSSRACRMLLAVRGDAAPRTSTAAGMGWIGVLSGARLSNFAIARVAEERKAKHHRPGRRLRDICDL